MFDFLLDEKNFSSLKQYINFLNVLPVALNEIQRFSDYYQRSGHVLMTPPNAHALTLAATANESRWRAITTVVPSLNNSGIELVKQVSTFLREFEQVAEEAVGPARRQPLGKIDPLRFTPINVGSHGTNRPPDVLYLINNLCSQLDQFAKALAQLKLLVVEISQTIHSVFMRFIDALTSRLCICDAPVSKLEAYYALGQFSLPNMQYEPGGYYSEAQRREKAREHLKALAAMYVSATSAANNLADFCHRLTYFLTHMRLELQSNDSERSLSRARSSMAQIAHPLKELATMVNALTQLSLNLKA